MLLHFTERRMIMSFCHYLCERVRACVMKELRPKQLRKMLFQTFLTRGLSMNAVKVKIVVKIKIMKITMVVRPGAGLIFFSLLRVGGCTIFWNVIIAISHYQLSSWLSLSFLWLLWQALFFHYSCLGAMNHTCMWWMLTVSPLVPTLHYSLASS